MLIPVKHSVAVVIFSGDKVLSVRRADDDDELPGVWGLPAGTLRAGETTEEIIKRIGRDKLGVELRPVKQINAGNQMRKQYLLEMELWKAAIEGDAKPLHPQWKWAEIESFREGAAAGSLCCELALKGDSRVSS
jgi:ADP-ribose pyrophosphatase YjhB (NUDIX family)